MFKKKIIVISLVIVLVLLGGIGVSAIWTNNLVTTGNASAGNMDIRFASQNLTCVDPAVTVSILPDADRKVLTFNIGKMKPDTVVDLTSIVKNEGDVSVKFDTAVIGISNPVFGNYLKVYNINAWSPPGAWDPLSSWSSTLNANPIWPTYVLTPGSTIPFNAKIKFDPPGNAGIGQNTNITMTLKWKST